MPDLTLIVGGPGSGKTDEVISRLAARYLGAPFSEAVVLGRSARPARAGRLRVRFGADFAGKLLRHTCFLGLQVTGDGLEGHGVPCVWHRGVIGDMGIGAAIADGADLGHCQAERNTQSQTLGPSDKPQH